MPADMSTVENQSEDRGLDMMVYKDSEGHTYDFGYGMNWHGLIQHKRNKTYLHKKNKPDCYRETGSPVHSTFGL